VVSAEKAIKGSCDKDVGGSAGASLSHPRRKIAAGDNSYMGKQTTVYQYGNVLPVIKRS
jgi:hypothetical protein